MDMNYLMEDEFDNLFIVEGKHVTIDFEVFSEDEDSEMLSYIPMLKSNGGYMKFNLELPVKPTSHNATVASEDGKTLTWDLTRLNAGEKVHAEFDIPSRSIPVWVYAIIGVIAVVLIIAEIVDDVIAKKKKSEATKMDQLAGTERHGNCRHIFTGCGRMCFVNDNSESLTFEPSYAVNDVRELLYGGSDDLCVAIQRNRKVSGITLVVHNTD